MHLFRKMVYLITFWLSFSYAFKSLINLHLVKSFIKEKSIKDATLLLCLHKHEKISFAKNLMFYTQKISITTGKNINLNTKNGQMGVIVDASCPNSSNYIHKCGELKHFDAKHHWLIIAPNSSIFKLLKNVTLNINANLEVAIPDKPNEYTILDVYNPASNHGGVLQTNKIGNFTQNQGYNARITRSKYWMRKNMTGVTFKTIVVLPVAFQGSLHEYLANDANRDVNTFNRFHSRLIHFCQDYYNFSMNIAVEQSWGYTYPNCSFDGMVGALERKEIDFGSSPLFVREDRAKAIEYGRRTWMLRAAFIFRNPKTPGSICVFLRPLSTPIWLLTAFLATLSICILKLVTTVEQKRFHADRETSWSVLFLATLGAFCQQGLPSTPSMTCGRIATIFIFLLSIIIYQFYSASIVSTLLMSPSTTIKTLKDLLDSSLRVSCEDILYTKDFLAHTNDPTIRELYQRKILESANKSGFISPKEGLVEVEKGGFAFHVEVATAYPIIERDYAPKRICELRELLLFPTQPMHANYQKESPFRDMLDTWWTTNNCNKVISCFSLQRLGEHGILQRERTHWHPRKPECLSSADSATFSVDLDDFYPVLGILLVGVPASLAVLAVEWHVKRRPAHPPIIVVLGDEAVLPFAH